MTIVGVAFTFLKTLVDRKARTRIELHKCKVFKKNSKFFKHENVSV